MTRLLLAALLLAGCGDRGETSGGDPAGRGLERAATAAGLVAAADDPVGLYANDTDRLCVVKAGDGYRVGATVDYGPEHRCSAAGTASGSATLQVRLAEDCRFVARFDGNRMVFPAVLPAGCDRACIGRASLAAFEADRLSGSPAEAAAMSDAAGGRPCAT